jgi:hypothetical protein
VVQQLAARSMAADTGMTFEQALEALAFHDAASEVLDDLESAVGESSGDMWFDWSDHQGRLKLAVAGTADPPSGPNVDEAKRILLERGLLDRVDFVRIGWSMSELIAGQKRADKTLRPLWHATNVSGWIDPSTNSVVIETANDLGREHLEIVEAAVRAAGVTVRVDPSLGPGPDPNLPPVPVQWTLLSVGENLQSVLVTFPTAPHARHRQSMDVRETDQEIWISVALPDFRSSPGTLRPDIAMSDRMTIALGSPIRGRKLSGPERSPSWRSGSRYFDIGVGESLIPRVVGLSPDDAERLLRAQQLVPKGL